MERLVIFERAAQMTLSEIAGAGRFGDKRLTKRGLFFFSGWLSAAVARCGERAEAEPRSLALAGFLAIPR